MNKKEKGELNLVMHILTESRIKGKYMFATIALVAMMLAGSVTILQPSTMQAQAAPAELPYLSMEPSVYHANAVNETFTVSIVLNDVDPASNCIGFEFKLVYNTNWTSLLELLAINNGSFLEASAGAPNGGVFYFGPVYGVGYVLFAGMILPDINGVWHTPLLSGTGTIATMQFKAIYQPPDGSAASCEIGLNDVKIADTAAHVISNKATSFLYIIGPILSVEPSAYHATSINETFTVSIVAQGIIPAGNCIGFEFKLGYNTTLLQVLAVNNGTFLEGFAGAPNGGMFYFAPVFGTNYVLFGGYILPDTNGVWHAPFPSGSGTVATIQFKTIYPPPAGQAAACDLRLYNVKIANTTAQILSNYAISGRYDIALPGLVGDLNGDKVVDIFDALLLAKAFGTKPGDPQWNVLADINHDNAVDIFDAIMLASHFGQKG